MAVILMGVISAASGQILYSGGTYTQNFNTLSSNTDTGGLGDLDDPWTDNSTITGWYSNQNTYTTDPVAIGLGLTNQLTSAGSGSDRALGAYIGLASVLNPIIYGLRIQNNQSFTLTQFTLTFDTEGFTSGLGGVLATDILTSFNLSYSTTATDVSGAGAVGYQAINGSSNQLSLNLLGTSTSTATIEVTIGNLNLASGQNLWIRWERSGTIGILDNALSTDNLQFAAVPEPSTFLMLGLGLALLAALKRGRRPAALRSKPHLLFGLAALALSGAAGYAQFSAHVDAPAAPSTTHLGIGTDDALTIRQTDGTVRQIKPGAKAQLVALPEGPCRISYGKNRAGEAVIIISPDPNATQPVRIRLQNSTVEISEDAVATLTVKPHAEKPEINPGYTGTVKMDGQQVPARDPLGVDSVKRDGKALYLYDPEWQTASLEKDFATERALDLEQGKIRVLNPPKFDKSGPYFLAAVEGSSPPEIVWLRQQSYLKQDSQDSLLQTASYNPEAGLASLKTLGHRELFGGAVDPSRMAARFFALMPELLRGTQETQALLKKTSLGQATAEDLRSLQQTGRVIWVVKCRLVDDLTPPEGDPDPIKDAITESLQVRLVPAATTPF
jgi:hypothetical protein